MASKWLRKLSTLSYLINPNACLWIFRQNVTLHGLIEFMHAYKFLAYTLIFIYTFFSDKIGLVKIFLAQH